MANVKIVKYADVRGDFAFKRCFGSEQYKAATIGLLNAMIPDIHVKDVTFLNTEVQGLSEEDRKGVIDVLCTGDDDSTFIVEMQRAPQTYFRERTYYYSSLYVVSQAQRGKWNFCYHPAYVVAFLDFSLEKLEVEFPKSGIPMLHYSTIEKTIGEKMPGSTEFYFFDLENFTKSRSELADNQDYWLYLLRNSGEMSDKPEQIKGAEFDTFFQAAQIAAFNKDERIQYEKDMVTARDYKNSLEWAKQYGAKEGFIKGKAEGKVEGKAEASREMAEKLLNNGVDIAIIASCTGLSVEEIKKLQG